MKRLLWLTWPFIGLAALSLLVCAWVAFDRSHGRRQWEKYRTAAVARGVLLHFDDFLSPEIPAEDNYITGTVFEHLPTGESSGKFPLPRPKLNVPQTTLAERLEAQRTAMLDEKWLTKETAPADPGAAVLLGLERYQKDLADLRAARSRPGSRFPQSTKPLPDFDSGAIVLAWHIGSILCMKMQAHLATGQPAEALEDFLDLTRLYRATLPERSMVSGMMRVTNFTAMIRAVDSGIAAHLWRDEDLTRIASELDTIDLAADGRFTFSSERGFINDAEEACRGMSFTEWRTIGGTFGAFTPEWRLWVEFVSGHHWRKQVRENQDTDSSLKKLETGFDRSADLFATPPISTPFAFGSNTDAILLRYITLENTRRQTRIACALERFRIQHGSYPESLSELVPALLPAIPADIINGAPMRYRRTTPATFLLYSIGANARDDEGSTLTDATTPSRYKARDWLWPEPTR